MWYPCPGLPLPALQVDSSHLKQSLAGAQIGVFVGLGLGRKRAIGCPDVEEGLHGLKLLRPEHVERGGGQHEVREAAVELLLEVEVVEGLREMGPVKVSVDAEHLAKDHLAHIDELLREAGPLADPLWVTRVRQLGKGRRRDGRIVSIRHSSGIGREDVGVVNLARDPPLHQRHVLVSRQLDGLPVLVEPSEGVVAPCRHARTTRGIADGRPIVLLFMDDADKVPEIAVMFDDLMRDPLALLNRLWPSAEGHKVALDNVLDILSVDPEGEGSREVVRVDDVVATRHDAARLVHADGLGERRGVWQRRDLGSEVCGGLAGL